MQTSQLQDQIQPQDTTIPTVIIEVSGGNVVAVYTNTAKLVCYLVDWDNEEDGEMESAAEPYPLDRMEDINDDVKRLLNL